MATVTSVAYTDKCRQGRKLLQLAQAQGLASVAGAVATGRIDTVNVDEIVVSPNAREKGVGAQLMRMIIQWAKHTGRLVTLHPPNDALRKYYLTLGFEFFDEIWRTTTIEERKRVHFSEYCEMFRVPRTSELSDEDRWVDAPQDRHAGQALEPVRLPCEAWSQRQSLCPSP